MPDHADQLVQITLFRVPRDQARTRRFVVDVMSDTNLSSDYCVEHQYRYDRRCELIRHYVRLTALEASPYGLWQVSVPVPDAAFIDEHYADVSCRLRVCVHNDLGVWLYLYVRNPPYPVTL